MWPYLSTSHTPLIEALQHGGVAQHMRRALTAFGSGWRGLVSLSSKQADELFSSHRLTRMLFGVEKASEATAFAAGGAKLEQAVKRATKFAAEGRPGYDRLAEELKSASVYSQSGFNPVFLNKDKLQGADVRRIIRHERIHAWHSKFGSLPKPLLEQARANLGEEYLSTLRKAYPREKWVEEELAYGFDESKTFFRHARAISAVPQDLATIQANLFRSSTGTTPVGGLSRSLRQLPSARTTSKSL